MPRALAALLVAVSIPIAPRAARAQGEDALPIPPGTLRLVFAPEWVRYNERFGLGTPGYADGALEPLAVDYAAESLGTARLTFLQQAESQLRSLTGLSGFGLSLGRARLSLNASVRAMPLGFELGITRRLAITVMVPLVRARVEAFLLGPSSDTGAVAAATLGNVGWNPAYLEPGALDAFRDEVDAALLALRDAAANGPASLRAEAQAALDALQPLLCGLAVLGAGSPAAASLCAGGLSPVPTPFLPLAGTEAGDSLSLRLARAQQDYAELRDSLAAQGYSIPALTQAFALPDSALDSLDLRHFFSDPAGIMAADSLTTVVRTRLGDVEASAVLQLAAKRAFRSQLGLLVRLPTGHRDSPDNLIDVGTGDRQWDVELASRNDVVLGDRFWVHAGARYGVQMADQLERRVSPPWFPFAPASSKALVRRDLGDYVSVDLVPNWQLDDAFSVGIGWHYFKQGATTFEYVDPADQARIGLPASVLGQETEVTRMRFGAGVTFSTLGRYAAGRARLPYTVSASYQNTFRGRGGNVPKASLFLLKIRGYLRLW